MNNSMIFGKNQETNIVSIDISKDKVHLFKEYPHEVKCHTFPAEYWILFSEYRQGCHTLKGKQHYKYGRKFTKSSDLHQVKRQAKMEDLDVFSPTNKVEQLMTKDGYTLFKGMDPKDVSVLSFDIETTGLKHDNGSFVLMITNTYRKGGSIERRMFKYDDYKDQKTMIKEWCDYVREVNPTILLGHNIFGFDLPYLKYCAGGPLKLGRDGGAAKFSNYDSQFRKDGSQTYSYNNVKIFGRHVIDTMFLSIKFAQANGRAYESYGLKNIIDYEGLKRDNRILWDFEKDPVSSILESKRKGNNKPFEQFVKYCEGDGDDALALYDLMIPAFHYYTQSIPMSFQQIINRASGAQINLFMIRSYLQLGHSIPKASDTKSLQGGQVEGNPGIYKNVYKVDVASLYPSIIRQFEIYDEKKDPEQHLLKMTEYFTEERLKNKALGIAGDTKAKSVEKSQKIVINSIYGFLGAPGLHYNSPKNASLITQEGRNILAQGVEWAKEKGFTIVNEDTDAFSFTNGKKLDNFPELIEELNGICPEKIIWEDDGVYKKFIVLKSKNYITDDGKKITIKGSSMKDSKREPILKSMINDFITVLLSDKKDELYNLYHSYVYKAQTVDKENIAEWCAKKTVTKAVLTSERTNERRILEAIGNKHVQEGDKVYVFFDTDTSLKLRDDFDGQISTKKLYGKLYNTVKIFGNIMDVDMLPNYSLARNKDKI